MKIRNGFVSNSSSSSFIINKDNLTQEQVKLIHAHIEHAIEAKLFSDYSDKSDRWGIEEGPATIEGSTYMDNFDMQTYLSEIDVPSKYIKWSY